MRRLRRLWDDSQPWGWIGLSIAYFYLLFSFVSGVLLWVLLFLNPLSLRVLRNYWLAREEMSLAADVFAVQIKEYRRQRRERK